MPQINKKNTIHEHFVPQVYLNQFGIIQVKRKDKKGLVFQYDTTEKEKCEDRVPTDSICFDDNIYEGYKNGIQITPNLIEKHFAKVVEPYLGKITQITLDKTKQNKEVSSADLNELLVMMVIQTLRMPDVINGFANMWKIENKTNNEDAKRIALLFCTPFFQSINKEYQILGDKLYDEAQALHLAIGYTNDNTIITSDNPCVWLAKQNVDGTKVLMEVYYPLTSNMVLIGTRSGYNKSNCFEMSQHKKDKINSITAKYATRWIYSYHPLTEKQQRDYKKKTESQNPSISTLNGGGEN